MLEAKDQGHKRKCSSKKSLQKKKKMFQAISKVKKFFKKFFQAISKHKGLQINFTGDLQNFNNSKNSAVLEPRTEQFSRTWGQGLDLWGQGPWG